MRSASANLLPGLTSHRALSTIVRVTLLVLVVGVPLSLLKKPHFRTSTRILLEEKSTLGSMFAADNPVASLFRADDANHVQNQIELLKSEQMLSTAYRDADIPIGSARVTVAQIASTDVVQIDVESTTPTYAERLAKTLPLSFMYFLKGNEQSALINAKSAVQERLKQENELLIDAEIKMERLKVQPATGVNNAQLTVLTSEIEAHRATAAGLINAHEKLRLRTGMGHNPVMVISPAGQAQQVGPGRIRELFNIAGVGLVLGVAGVFVQAGMKGRKWS